MRRLQDAQRGVGEGTASRFRRSPMRSIASATTSVREAPTSGWGAGVMTAVQRSGPRGSSPERDERSGGREPLSRRGLGRELTHDVAPEPLGAHVGQREQDEERVDPLPVRRAGEQDADKDGREYG